MDVKSEGLNQGERPIDNAPTLTLRNGRSCIPQHYLQYTHSVASVEALMADIEFCERYPIFVTEDEGGICLQIGIIGYDNYKVAAKQKGPKIVFGRKWRVEPNLPTSEIIQTAFLAIKKAREHEIRELFTLTLNGKVTTPFNNHHDLPLMARNRDILESSSMQHTTIQSALTSLKFDGGLFQFEDLEVLRNGLSAVTLSYVSQDPKAHAELTKMPIVLLLQKLTLNSIYHALINEIISVSNRYVDKTFTYKGFARFSADVDAMAIASLSTDVRQNPEKLLTQTGERCTFARNFEAERYDTDITRVPQLSMSAYGKKLHDQLSAMKLSNFDMLLKAQQQKR